MKIEYPGNYQDVTIAEASKFYTAHTDIEKVAAFGNDTEALLKMKMNELAKVVEFLNEMMDSSQTAESMKFKHDGVMYGLFPDLHELEHGAYLDAVGYLTTEDSYWKNASKIANILFRRVTVDTGKRYEVEEYNPNLELFNELPVIYLNAAGFFLSNLGIDYENNTNSSILRLTTLEIKKARNLLKSGAATTLFSIWREKMLRRWKQ